jgi:5'-nucleotidase
MESVIEKPISLHDMDGCLFDFEGQMRMDLLRMKSPGEPDPFDSTSPMYIRDLWKAEEGWPWLKARMDLIKRKPGWWRELPQLRLGWDVFWMCVTIGFERQILTRGPSKKPHVWAEKLECIRQCKDISDCVVHITESKGQVYGRVLVDDYPPYVTAWLEHKHRGLVIMPCNAQNVGFSHPNVIHYDGNNRENIQVALKAAFIRKQHQHWKDCLA